MLDRQTARPCSRPLLRRPGHHRARHRRTERRRSRLHRGASGSTRASRSARCFAGPADPGGGERRRRLARLRAGCPRTTSSATSPPNRPGQGKGHVRRAAAVEPSTFDDVMGTPAWKSLPSWYLVAQNDEVIPPDAERQFAADGRRHDRGRQRTLRDGLPPRGDLRADRDRGQGRRRGQVANGKPRIFLGSSGKQKKLLAALTRGLENVAQVEPWTTSFNPGTTTLERLLELSHEVDFAAFVFARDDWTTKSRLLRRPRGRPGFAARQRRLRSRTFRRRPGNAPNVHPPCERREASQRSPGLTCVRYGEATTATEMKSHQSEASEGDRERGPGRADRGPVVAVLPDRAHAEEPSAVSLLADLARPRRGAGGDRPRLAGGRHPVGALLERGAKERKDPSVSSTTGTENGLGTRTRRNWTGPERSCRDRRSRGRILHDPFGRTRRSTRGRPASTCAPIRGRGRPGRTRRSATRRAHRGAPQTLEVGGERLNHAETASDTLIACVTGAGGQSSSASSQPPSLRSPRPLPGPPSAPR